VTRVCLGQEKKMIEDEYESERDRNLEEEWGTWEEFVIGERGKGKKNRKNIGRGVSPDTSLCNDVLQTTHTIKKK